jgi:hypothetical protein
MRRKKTRRRELLSIRADDHIADLLEQEASLMPSGFEEQADILRQQAKVFRESGRTETITVWKEIPKKSE